jgi:hypothetical protein
MAMKFPAFCVTSPCFPKLYIIKMRVLFVLSVMQASSFNRAAILNCEARFQRMGLRNKRKPCVNSADCYKSISSAFRWSAGRSRGKSCDHSGKEGSDILFSINDSVHPDIGADVLTEWHEFFCSLEQLYQQYGPQANSGSLDVRIRSGHKAKQYPRLIKPANDHRSHRYKGQLSKVAGQFRVDWSVIVICTKEIKFWLNKFSEELTSPDVLWDASS